MIEADKAKERCENNPAWNLPMVVGPIAFAYNVDGVDKLVLNAEVLAEIFDGTIKTWNDPKIAKLNSGANLPSANITVFFRPDESGTMENTIHSFPRLGNDAWKDEPPRSWTEPARARTSPPVPPRPRPAQRTPSPTSSGATPRGPQPEHGLSWTAAMARSS